MKCGCGRLVVPLVSGMLAGVVTAQPCEWSGVGGGMNVEVYALAEYGGDLYAGGAFLIAGGGSALRVARWDGQSWWPLSSGLTGPYNSPDALAMTVHDDGSGLALYVGGTFQSAGGVAANYMASWNGSAWSALGAGVGGRVWALAVFEGALYAGGAFTSAGGAASPSRVARWDGASGWSAVGQASTAGNVRALAVYDGALYAGAFNPAGGVPDLAIARWDGAAGVWSAVGGSVNGNVFALAVFEGGLYVGGSFNMAGGGGTGATPVSGLARWDGQAWSDVGGGISGNHLAGVRALTVWDAGTAEGPGLYVGGTFDAAGGVPASGIARWGNSTSPGWSALGPGIGQGFNPMVMAMAGHDDGQGRSLFVGGSFLAAGGVLAERIARWRCDPHVPPCYPNCDGSTMPPILNVEDFTCFINEFAAAQSLPPEQQVDHYANCDQSTTPPVLNVEDFTCFINAFAAGCP
jgi:trimeric autotransporter adhesin